MSVTVEAYPSEDTAEVGVRTILVVDDHRSFAEMLSAALDTVDGLVCVYALIQACTLTVQERRRTISVLRAFGGGAGAVRRLLTGAVAALLLPAAVIGILLERLVLGPVLANLAAADADALLRREGLNGPDAVRVTRFTHGHPLALRLAAAGVGERPDLSLEDAATQSVIAELTRLMAGGAELEALAHELERTGEPDVARSLLDEE